MPQKCPSLKQFENQAESLQLCSGPPRAALTAPLHWPLRDWRGEDVSARAHESAALEDAGAGGGAPRDRRAWHSGIRSVRFHPMNVYVSVCRTVSRYGSAALESTQVLSRVDENNGVTLVENWPRFLDSRVQRFGFRVLAHGVGVATRYGEQCHETRESATSPYRPTAWPMGCVALSDCPADAHCSAGRRSRFGRLALARPAHERPLPRV